MYAEGEGVGVKLTDRTERNGLIGDSFCVFLQVLLVTTDVLTRHIINCSTFPLKPFAQVKVFNFGADVIRWKEYWLFCPN